MNDRLNELNLGATMDSGESIGSHQRSNNSGAPKATMKKYRIKIPKFDGLMPQKKKVKKNKEKTKDVKLPLNDFFLKVECIKGHIKVVKDVTNFVNESHSKMLLTTKTQDENEINRQLQRQVEKANQHAKTVKDSLKSLQKENDQLEEKGDGTDEGIVKIRKNLSMRLTNEFIDVINQYQAAQGTYKQSLRNKVTRQVRIVRPEATDEEIDTIMKDEGGRDAFYQEQVLIGNVPNERIQSTLHQVHDKYRDILAIEQSIGLVHQMFLDLALLTEQQGEILDRIEYHIETSNDYVEKGNENVYESIQYQKRIRKRQMWMAVIIVIIIIIVVVVAT